MEEQEEICSLLDKLSLVIEKKKQQVKELDNLAQAIFYDMFGDPITNDKGWDISGFNDVFLISANTPFSLRRVPLSRAEVMPVDEKCGCAASGSAFC